MFLPGESHGQRSPAVYSPWGRKESDTTEQLTLSLFFIEKKIKIYNVVSRRISPQHLELVLFIILVLALLISFLSVYSKIKLQPFSILPQRQVSLDFSVFISNGILSQGYTIPKLTDPLQLDFCSIWLRTVL